jgi:CRP-like cAMP-binding protein
MNFRSCYLFADLGEAQVNRITSLAKEIPMKKGQRIFTEGDEAVSLYVLKEGAVELMSKIEDEFEMPISILRNAGDCFGASSLVPPHAYSISARCAGKGVLLAIERADLLRIIEEDHELGCIIMTNAARYFLEQLKHTRHEIKIHFTTLFKAMHR